MNDQAQAQTNEAPAAKAPNIDNVKREFYDVSKLEAGSAAAEYATEAAEAINGIVVYNFDVEKDFPEGYGLAVIPLQKKDSESGTMQRVGVAIGAVPSFELMMQDKDGAEYAKQAVEDALMAKLANATRPRADGSTAASVPFTLQDFVTSNRPEGVLVAFRKLAPAYVKVLKDKGLKLMTDGILRSILESKAFAEDQFASIPQETWEGLIDSMIAKANEKSMAPGLLEEWRKTRNEAGMPSDGDVDLEGLDFSKI